jgi:hypothetical protein
VQVLSREDVQQALRHALKLQAGRHTLTTATTLPAATAVSSGSSGGNSDGNSQGGGQSGDGVMSQQLSTDLNVAAGTAPSDVTAEATVSTTTTPTTPTSTTVDTTTGNSRQIVLSQWALDTAFSAALRVPTPRLGRPAARSKDEITSLVTDKHEKSLIGNVISPQDIGVTYDMIGTHLMCECAVSLLDAALLLDGWFMKRCTTVCTKHAQCGLSSVVTPHLLQIHSVCLCYFQLWH